METNALEALLLLRLWMDAKKKRARDVYKILTEGFELTSGNAFQTGMHRMGLPCNWKMAKGTYVVLANLAQEKRNVAGGDGKEQFVTLVEFDEALRQAMSEAEKTLAVTDSFSHGEDKRKKFDLRVWLSHGKNRQRLAEVLVHVYLSGQGKAGQGLSLDTGDRQVAMVGELAELPLDPLTFASVRVVLRHVPCIKEERARGKAGQAVLSPSIPSVANEVNEAAEMLYGSYLGPGMENVMVQMNKKIAFLTKALREESENLLESRLRASALDKDLSLCKIRLDDAVAQNAEYGALLKLVRLRKNIERKRDAPQQAEQGTGYDIDIQGSLLVNRNAKRELAKAKAEAEWWKQINKVSAIRYQKVYMSSDKYKSAALARQYKIKLRRSQRRVWRLAASAAWLQQEFNELSSVVERHVKRKLSLFEGQALPPQALLESIAAGMMVEGKDSADEDAGKIVTAETTATATQMTPEPEQAKGGAVSDDPGVNLATPQSLLATRRKTDQNIAALQSLESRDEAALIEQLGGQVEALNNEVEHERHLSTQVVGEKESVMLALRKRIAALESTIIRESSSSYSGRISSIRQQPYYSKSSRYLQGGASDPYKTPLGRSGSRNIYDRMRAFEQRMATSTSSASGTRRLARNLELREFANDPVSSSRHEYGGGYVASPPSSSSSLHQSQSLFPSTAGTRKRSNSAFYQSEIFDLTKALAKANLQVAKKANDIERLENRAEDREKELVSVKEFIAHKHANEASYLNKIKELSTESRGARTENENLRRIVNLKHLHHSLQYD
ncbi:hypothetical protein HOP50_13g70930 [Chloropicon primus]|uniref:Uncharacterized protein n=1 Tax=Chloropicon primus TaxID=1764295 RepID=A0A5B8MY28_9CHLO|nr:hypothetical protein A3770_13p70730 [Chloropicon primus]UPR03763.1 hypothetical protein HOP50_13g70930 [Chloropicon primus]|eukprot:QDZ24555.1 hypothetical protein A3770_13p70730 [Chloropicon primus]